MQGHGFWSRREPDLSVAIVFPRQAFLVGQLASLTVCPALQRGDIRHTVCGEARRGLGVALKLVARPLVQEEVDVLCTTHVGGHAALLSFVHLLQRRDRAPPPFQGPACSGHQVHQAQHHRQTGKAQHEVEHQRLLCRPGDVALHARRARGLVAQEASWDEEPEEQEVTRHEGRLHQDVHGHDQ